MRARRKRIVWVVVAGILLCLGAPLLLIGQQLRQESLNAALVQAVKKLDAPTVSRLLDEGASANAIDTDEPPPTLPQLLKRLLARLRHQPEGIASGKRKSVLALRLTRDELYRQAPRDNSVDTIAAMLITHGSDLHIRNELQETPLHIAAWSGLHQTVRALLARGVAVDPRSRSGSTPLMGADDENTKLLAEHGADVNTRTPRVTPLMDAVFCDHLEATQTLIQHGADVNATDDDGLSILYNVETDNFTIPHRAALIRLLQQHGARLNQQDKAALAREQQPAPTLSKAGKPRRAKKGLPSNQTHHKHQARTTEAR